MSALEIKHDLKVENKFVFLDDSEDEEPDTRSATAKKKAKKKAKAQAKLEGAAAAKPSAESATAEPSAVDTSASFIDPVRDYVFDDEQESAVLANFELPSDQKKKMRKKDKEGVAAVVAAKDTKDSTKGDKPLASTSSVTPAPVSVPTTAPAPAPAPVAAAVSASPSAQPAAVAFNPSPTFENKELLTKALIEMGYQSGQISMALFTAVLQPGFTSVRGCCQFFVLSGAGITPAHEIETMLACLLGDVMSCRSEFSCFDFFAAVSACTRRGFASYHRHGDLWMWVCAFLLLKRIVNVVSAGSAECSRV
jgi:hypothetical protein